MEWQLTDQCPVPGPGVSAGASWDWDNIIRLCHQGQDKRHETITLPGDSPHLASLVSDTELTGRVFFNRKIYWEIDSIQCHFRVLNTCFFFTAVSVCLGTCGKSNSWMGDIITNIPGCPCGKEGYGREILVSRVVLGRGDQIVTS